MSDKLRFGEILVRAGVLERAALESAAREWESTGGDLGELLVRRGVIDETTMLQTVGKALNLPTVSLENVSPDPRAVQRLPRALCVEHLLVPLEVERSKTGEHLHVAMANPSDVRAIKEVTRAARLRIRPLVASAREIRAAIQRFYGPGAGDDAPTTAVRRPPPPAGPPLPEAPRPAPSAPDVDAASPDALFDFGVMDLSADAPEGDPGASGELTPESSVDMGDLGLDLGFGAELDDEPVGSRDRPPPPSGEGFGYVQVTRGRRRKSGPLAGDGGAPPVARESAGGPPPAAASAPTARFPAAGGAGGSSGPLPPLPGRPPSTPSRPLPPLPPDLRSGGAQPADGAPPFVAEKAPADPFAAPPPRAVPEPPGLVNEPEAPEAVDVRRILERYQREVAENDEPEDEIIADHLARYGRAPAQRSADDALDALDAALGRVRPGAGQLVLALVRHLARRGLIDPAELLAELQGEWAGD